MRLDRPTRRFGSNFWWLILLVGPALVLLTGYGAVTTRRFEWTNGFTGELVTGQKVGQSFVARYPNLSGVELRIGTYRTDPGPANATIVLRLKEDAGSDRDLATVELPAGTQLDPNPWYLFSFPPIADSQDRTYYLEVESPDGAPGSALTLSWWQSNVEGDPYQGGTVYFDGQPKLGDLTFGLRYSSSPLDAAAQVARAMSANVPVPLMLLLSAGMAVVVLGLFYLPAALREPERRRLWLRRWSLPCVLGVALLHGLVYLFVVPPWQGPDEHAHLAYVALLDRYDLNPDTVWSHYLQGDLDADALIEGISASMARHDFTRRVAGHPAPGAPPDPGATLFLSLSKPPGYYWLSAASLSAARGLGIAADPYTDPDTALRVLRGVSLGLGLVVVMLAWVAAQIIAPPANWMRLLLPLTVALLPMHTFDVTVANNDVLAEVAVSGAFVALAGLLRWPVGWRGVGLATLAVLLTAASLWTKATAGSSILLLVLGLMVWAGLLATRALEKRGWRAPTGRRQAFAVPGALAGLAAVAMIGALLWAYQPRNEPAGWVNSRWPWQPLPRVESPTARDGRFVLEMDPGSEEAATGFQVLLLPTYHPAMQVTVSGWARSVMDADGRSTMSPTAFMKLEAGGFPLAQAEVSPGTDGTWQPISATAQVEAGTQQVVLRIAVEDRRVQFDDFSLRVDFGATEWRDPVFRPVLLNPSAEAGSWGLRPEVARMLPYGMVAAAEVLANPQPFDKLALWGQYADGQYRSFWGEFGWLSIPLPATLYTLLAALLALALVGITIRAVTRWGRWTWADWLGVVALASFAATILATYTWQIMGLATRSVMAGLAGRYLFVLIIPIVWLILVGLGQIAALLRRRIGRDAETRLPWGVWLYVACLVTFAGYCLLALIVPYYYA